VGHATCGWYRPDDADVREWTGELQIAATGKATMQRSALARLASLGLVRIGNGAYCVTELGRLLVARIQSTCACGAALQWDTLPRVGVQDDFAGGALELKNCPTCGSTRARALEAP
jgi:hypothetical protein